MSRFFKQFIFISFGVVIFAVGGAIKKSLFAERLFGMDPAGFAPASLGANTNLLPHTTRAQVHDFIITEKAPFPRDFLCSTQL